MNSLVINFRHYSSSPAQNEATVLPAVDTTAPLSTLHVVDQAIIDIARHFRFTTEEVKEYYDRCGDINRTTNRFRRMREVLTNLPDDDGVPLVSGAPLLMTPMMNIIDGSTNSEPSGRVS